MARNQVNGRPPWHGIGARAAARPPSARPSIGNGAGRNTSPIRYAVIGGGPLAPVAILPAFAHAAESSQLVALVWDDPGKVRALGRAHGVGHLAGYDRLEACLRQAGVDAVFIALPTHLHPEYAVRAARAGAHVLCEKPMAITERECEAMIQACNRNGVKLMITYRLHFEQTGPGPGDLVRSGKLGEPRIYNAVFTRRVDDRDARRRESPPRGGGPLYAVGIDGIHAARSLFRDEPLEAFAAGTRSEDLSFGDVDQMTTAVLRFSGDRLAAFTCSFGPADVSTYQIVGTEGDVRVDPAPELAEPSRYRRTVVGTTVERTFRERDQLASELVHFSSCILRDEEPEPSGREGLADVRVIRALLRSAKSGRPVGLPSFARRRISELELRMRKPALERCRRIEAKSPWDTA